MVAPRDIQLPMLF